MRLGTGLLTCTALLAAATVGEQARATGFATYYALVAIGGTTIQGSGVTSSAKTGVGTYNVTFARRVNDCSHNVTLRGQAAGQFAAGPKAGNNLVVVVTTFSAAGAKQDRSFNLTVLCNS